MKNFKASKFSLHVSLHVCTNFRTEILRNFIYYFAPSNLKQTVALINKLDKQKISLKKGETGSLNNSIPYEKVFQKIC